MKIFFLCLQLMREIEARDEEACLGFPYFLDQFIPRIACEIFRLDERLAARVRQFVVEELDFFGVSRAVGKLLLDELGRDELGHAPGLVVCCNSESALAKLVKSEEPTAEWGGSYDRLSAVYYHDPYAIWHETLHLFDAKDCYELDGNKIKRDRTCNDGRCIMQYEPSVEIIGDSPIICRMNVDRIRNFTVE